MKKPLIAVIPVLLLFGTAYALDTPPMKEGLWKLHMTTTSAGAAPMDMNYSVCRDHAFDAKTHEMVDKRPGCTLSAEAMSGNKRAYTMSCKIGPTVVVSKSLVTWSGDTHFHSESDITYTPAMRGITHQTMVEDQVYVGSCPAGVTPGTRLGANGQPMNRH